tara:strand:- start:550 stop:1023 length:474 start_codon:yes stop_codon:yes gene_type:complete
MSTTHSYIIEDPLGIIGERKTKEIKKWCKENNFKSKLFIQYLNKPEYTFADKNFSSNQNAYIIKLYESRPLSKKQLFQKKLESIQKARSADVKFDEVFSLYKQILNLEPLQKLSKDVIKMAVPHPKQIIDNKNLYEDKIDSIPPSILKTYFDKCMSI